MQSENDTKTYRFALKTRRGRLYKLTNEVIPHTMNATITPDIGRTYERMLRASGISVTKPRLAIMQYLMQNHVHPTAEVIYTEISKSNPGMSRATIYNTVNKLAECGVLTTLTIDEKTQHFDINTTPHGHLHCTTCGKIYDLPLRGITTDQAYRHFELDGHCITEVHQYYRGICQECLRQNNSYNQPQTQELNKQQ